MKEKTKTENFVMLIVDDETETLKIFKETFELRGWHVFTAPTGDAGLAIIKKEKIDIVLLDIRLPGKPGLEVLKEMKMRYPDLRVVIITALGYEDELVNEALRLGASGYASKTVPLNEVIGVIKNALIK